MLPRRPPFRGTGAPAGRAACPYLLPTLGFRRPAGTGDHVITQHTVLRGQANGTELCLPWHVSHKPPPVPLSLCQGQAGETEAVDPAGW